jgi:hypothetical protein
MEDDSIKNQGEFVPNQENKFADELLYLPAFRAQVESFISGLEAYNDLKPEHARRDPKNYAFLRQFLGDVFRERNARTYELETSDYLQTVALAQSEFPTPMYWVDCMDGRVLEVIKHGVSFGIGNSIRVPGGILREFVRGRDAKLMLMEKSAYADQLQFAFQKADVITEVFDSHLSCAARKAEEQTSGKDPHDAGLYADVMHKKEMAAALNRHVAEIYKGKKKAIAIQTSFDPHSGFMYMGLETEHALAYAKGMAAGQAEIEDNDGDQSNRKVSKPEYTDEVLSNLKNLGAIIDTQSLSQIPEIYRVFQEECNFHIDWKKDYVGSAIRFWSAVESIKGQVAPIIRDQVINIYPHLNEPENATELDARVMLLLTNTLSGYLHNVHEMPEIEETVESEEQSRYGYGVHREQIIKVYEGGQPPYDISAFVINPGVRDLATNIELAASLVRANRKSQRITDSTGIFEDPSEFAEAVVPVIVQEIVRGNVSEDEWEQLTNIDWYDEDNPLPEDWDRMSSSEFYTFLTNHGVNNLSLAKGINNLRLRMAQLYDPNVPTSSHLIEQYKIALPTISGRNRRNRCVLPFMKSGF